MMENAHRISFVGPGTLFGPGVEKRSAATVEKASKELETRFPAVPAGSVDGRPPLRRPPGHALVRKERARYRGS
jgi:hypothetical protein